MNALILYVDTGTFRSLVGTFNVLREHSIWKEISPNKQKFMKFRVLIESLHTVSKNTTGTLIRLFKTVQNFIIYTLVNRSMDKYNPHLLTISITM